MVGLVAGAAAVVLWGINSYAVVATIVLTFFILTTIIVRFVSVVRARSESLLKASIRVLRNEPGYWGGQIAHIGVAVFIIGATFAGINSIKKTEKLAPGQSHTVNGIRFEFVSARFLEGPNYNAYEARFHIHDKGKVIAVFPQKRFYLKRTQLMTEAGIHWQLNRDLVISMGKPLNTFVKNFYGQAKHELTQARRDHVAELLKTTSWPITIKYKPFMRLTWLGAIIMAFGGLIATLDKRYRLFSRKKLASMQAPTTDTNATLLGEEK